MSAYNLPAIIIHVLSNKQMFHQICMKEAPRCRSMWIWIINERLIKDILVSVNIKLSPNILTITPLWINFPNPKTFH